MLLFNRIKQEKGVTLVELLAVIILFSLIAVTTTSILVTALNNNKEIAKKFNVRNEADFLMSKAVRELYPLQDSKIKGIKENIVNVNGKQIKESFLVYEKDSLQTFTGFKLKSNSAELEFYVHGTKIPIETKGVKISSKSVISYISDPTASESHKYNVYNISLVLEYLYRDNLEEITFKNQITTIKDEEKVPDEEE